MKPLQVEPAYSFICPKKVFILYGLLSWVFECSRLQLKSIKRLVFIITSENTESCLMFMAPVVGHPWLLNRVILLDWHPWPLIPSWHRDTFWKGKVHLNTVRVKLNSWLSMCYCGVRRGMQSVKIISLSQAPPACSTKSIHVASLILSKNWVGLITKYDRQVLRLSFIVCFNFCIITVSITIHLL